MIVKIPYKPFCGFEIKSSFNKRFAINLLTLVDYRALTHMFFLKYQNYPFLPTHADFKASAGDKPVPTCI